MLYARAGGFGLRSEEEAAWEAVQQEEEGGRLVRVDEGGVEEVVRARWEKGAEDDVEDDVSEAEVGGCGMLDGEAAGWGVV